jgi:hypothetical protein
MSRQMLAAIGTALFAPARRRRLKSKIMNPPKITSRATDQITFEPGIETKIATTPNTSGPGCHASDFRRDRRARAVNLPRTRSIGGQH